MKEDSKRKQNILAVLTLFIPALIVIIAAISDFFYYYYPNVWMSDQNLLGRICICLWQNGITYNGVLGTLKNNFGVLVTSISVIITLSIQNLNRSEGRTFGLKRFEFDVSKRRIVYTYTRRMVFFAPFIMIAAVMLNACILGYSVLFFCYLFLILSFLWFESSFTPEKDWDRIFEKMYRKMPYDPTDYEDTIAYELLLSGMRQWNDREGEWEGTHYLFDKLLSCPEKCSFKKKYILCCFFYEMMYVRNSGAECERAAYELMEYVTKRDIEGWDDNCYLLLWGMMHCLFMNGGSEYILYFFKWYMDFPARYRNLLLTLTNKDHIRDVENRINDFFQNVPRQTGILLIEFEEYLNRQMEQEEINMEIWEKLPQLWTKGKDILSEDKDKKKFREDYLEIYRSCSLNADEFEKRMQNLLLDYRYGTGRSQVVFFLKYIGGLNGDRM